MTRFLLACALCAWAAALARGQSTLDIIGITALRAQDPTLTGQGVFMAQIESAPNPLQFEVNPTAPGVGNNGFLVYASAKGMARKFPNQVGSESSHADTVAEALFGASSGVATGLPRVFNYETRYFYPHVILSRALVRPLVFNQSFEFGNHNAAQDMAYDNYIAQFHTIVASGIGNGGPILTPADCYNGLGVAAYGGGSSTGPTADGRCKPDITAPAGATSFSTPLVSGAAAILIQGGRRQVLDAGPAVDSRTVKALLLTGADKPAGWTQTITAPLDPHYGAGILNVFNSYAELAGGRFAPSAISLSATTHLPLASGSAINAARGWDYRGIASVPAADGVSHYRIISSGIGALITTLVWNKAFGAKKINQLSLYVYNANGNLMGSSQSTVDNVQHIYLPSLTAGIYEIEVVKKSGASGTPGVVSGAETYSLAWDFGR